MVTNEQLALIVEDDHSSAELYGRLLEMVGFSCVIKHRLPDALEALDEFIPNLVLLDMRISNSFGGVDVLHKLKSHSKYADTRIVIISAFSSLIKEYEDQVDMAILKPINARELVSTAEKFSR